MAKYEVHGPPGTGKTTYVARQCRLAAKKYGPDGVLVCSLTKAAAREAAGRQTNLDTRMIGTLHALCYRMFDGPTLVSEEHIILWNEKWPMYRQSEDAVTTKSRDDDVAPQIAKTQGDKYRIAAELYRARLTSMALWDNRVRSFHVAWSEFRAKNDICDFTDLIERAIKERPLPPYGASVIFADEYQDFSALEEKLFDIWNTNSDSAVVVGDPDQAMYGWRGASQDALAREPHKVLEQSYRVPRTVHQAAMSIIGLSGTANKYGRYMPRREDFRDPESPIVEGAFNRLGFNMEDTSRVVDTLEQATVEEYASAMLITPCNYQLKSVTNALRQVGLPYHNPHSGRWNPLCPPRGVAYGQRLTALLAISPQHMAGEERSLWTPRQVKRWGPMMLNWNNDRGTGVWLYGKKKACLDAIDDDWNEAQLSQHLRQAIPWSVIEKLYEGDMAWVQGSMSSAARKACAYPLAIVDRFNVPRLRDFMRRSLTHENFGIQVGTIHSVKGGEADTVLLCPDLSQAGFKQYQRPGWDNRDAVLRMMYVGATRAKSTLSILMPSSEMNPHI